MSGDQPKFLLRRVVGELLAILLFAALMASLTVPRIGGDGGAQRAACMQKMQALGSAQLRYAVDWDAQTPRDFSFEGEDAKSMFVSSLVPYLGETESFRCSASVRNGPEMTYEHFKTLAQIREFSGSINLNKLSENASTPWMHDEITSLSQTEDGLVVNTRHADELNRVAILFFDGQVEQKITPLYPSNPLLRLD